MKPAGLLKKIKEYNPNFYSRGSFEVSLSDNFLYHLKNKKRDEFSKAPYVLSINSYGPKHSKKYMQMVGHSYPLDSLPENLKVYLRLCANYISKIFHPKSIKLFLNKEEIENIRGEV